MTELKAGGGELPVGGDVAGMVAERLGPPSSGGWSKRPPLRYAIFPESRRLVIHDRGKISTYDTGDHQILGVAQAQSSERTLSFTSQSGLVKVTDLTKV